jgi:hypothetical protein
VQHRPLYTVAREINFSSGSGARGSLPPADAAAARSEGKPT